MRIFPRALALADLDTPASELAREAALWLELDEVADGPEYYSLGHRRARLRARLARPASAGRAVAAEEVAAARARRGDRRRAAAALRITNRHGFTDLSELHDGVAAHATTSSWWPKGTLPLALAAGAQP